MYELLVIQEQLGHLTLGLKGKFNVLSTSTATIEKLDYPDCWEQNWLLQLSVELKPSNQASFNTIGNQK